MVQNVMERIQSVQRYWSEFYCSDYYDVSANKYGIKCRTSLRLWADKGWINKIGLYTWFQWYFRYWLGTRPQDDERQINRWKRIVSRFRGKLVRIIKESGDKFDDYSISPKIRQILLHWGYKLTQEDFFYWFGKLMYKNELLLI